MKGHITKKGDNYYIVVDVGRDHTGKRKQKWFSGYKRKKDAEKDLPKILTKLEKGYKEPEDMTVKEYFENWLDRKKQTVAYGTYAHYKSYVNNHIIPGIGHWKINKIKNHHVESFVDEINAKKISQRTKKHIFRILSSALNKGQRFGMDENIMEDIAAPRVERQETEFWSEKEVQAFVSSLNSKNHSTPIMLALATGMRKGEILGLTWSKVDLINKTISVTHQLKQQEKEDGTKEWVLSPQLKTKTSYRTIKIDDDTVKLLEAHKKQQEKDKMKLGKDYMDKDLVCATTIGDSIKPSYMRTVFNRTIDKSGVKKISFHGLRHTHATLLLTNGVHPKVVQERLGHRSIETTLDTYSHIIPGIQEIAAQSINKSLYPKANIKDENILPFNKNSNN